MLTNGTYHMQTPDTGTKDPSPNDLTNANATIANLQKQLQIVIFALGKSQAAEASLQNELNALKQSKGTSEKKPPGDTRQPGDTNQPQGEPKTLEEAKTMLQNKQNELVQSQQQVQNLTASLQQAQAQLQSKDNELTQVKSQLQGKDNELTQVKSQLQGKVNELSQAQTQIQNLTTSLQQAQSDSARATFLESENQRLRQEAGLKSGVNVSGNQCTASFPDGSVDSQNWWVTVDRPGGGYQEGPSPRIAVDGSRIMNFVQLQSPKIYYVPEEAITFEDTEIQITGTRLSEPTEPLRPLTDNFSGE